MAERSEIPVFKNDPMLVLLLGFITCGLYMIYWNKKAAEVLNKVSGREVISPVIAILGGCCMPLNVYFYYLAGQSLADVGAMIGKPELKEKSTILVVLGLFLSPVAAMIVQGHLNEIYPSQNA